MAMLMDKVSFGEPDRDGFMKVEIEGLVDYETAQHLMAIFRDRVDGRGPPPGLRRRPLSVHDDYAPNGTIDGRRPFSLADEPRRLGSPDTHALPPGSRIIEGEFDDG